MASIVQTAYFINPWYKWHRGGHNEWVFQAVLPRLVTPSYSSHYVRAVPINIDQIELPSLIVPAVPKGAGIFSLSIGDMKHASRAWPVRSGIMPPGVDR